MELEQSLTDGYNDSILERFLSSNLNSPSCVLEMTMLLVPAEILSGYKGFFKLLLDNSSGPYTITSFHLLADQPMLTCRRTFQPLLRAPPHQANSTSEPVNEFTLLLLRDPYRLQCSMCIASAGVPYALPPSPLFNDHHTLIISGIRILMCDRSKPLRSIDDVQTISSI